MAASQRISDFHLCTGPMLPDGRPNLQETFLGDDAYAAMLEAFVHRFKPEVQLTLEWAGDMVDFHGIPYRGKFGSIPTVEAAMEKLETNMKGHPRFWDATADFLVVTGRRLDITIGNHDFEFAWPEVQERIRERLRVGRGDRRLRFMTTTHEGDTWKLHGDYFDAPNASPPESEWFITEKYKGRERKLLNVPYGSIVNATLGQALRLRRPTVGRTSGPGEVWTLSIAREWTFLGLAVIGIVWTIIHHKLIIRQKNVRKKATFRNMYELTISTIGDDEVLREIADLAAKNPDLRHVEAGHTHRVGVTTLTVDGREVTYWNTGTGVDQVRLRRPEFEKFYTRWPKQEAFIRRIAFYWKEDFWTAFGLTIIHVAVIFSPLLMRDLFHWTLEDTGKIIVGVAIFSLLMRMSFALHVDEYFTEYTPLETRRYDDGSVDRQLLRYKPEEDAFERYRKA